MHTENIIKLIRGEAQYDRKTLPCLLKIIRKYPYFQSAHLLYTLNLFHLEDMYFSCELRKTAAYLNDRKKLFFWVENRFFDSDKITAIHHEIPKNPNSVFHLIDSFLSRQEKMQDLSAVSTDYVSHYLLEGQEEESGQPQPLQFQDAIDRFLRKDELSQIKIELDDGHVKTNDKQKTEETTVPDSEQSDDDDFFSETLVKIYIQQRKYDKALGTIQKIVLHYPEKSSYFADRIQMLEDLIGINKNKTK